MLCGRGGWHVRGRGADGPGSGGLPGGARGLSRSSALSQRLRSQRSLGRAGNVPAERGQCRDFRGAVRRLLKPDAQAAASRPPLSSWSAPCCALCIQFGKPVTGRSQMAPTPRRGAPRRGSRTSALRKSRLERVPRGSGGAGETPQWPLQTSTRQGGPQPPNVWTRGLWLHPLPRMNGSVGGGGRCRAPSAPGGLPSASPSGLQSAVTFPPCVTTYHGRLRGEGTPASSRPRHSDLELADLTNHTHAQRGHPVKFEFQIKHYFSV